MTTLDDQARVTVFIPTFNRAQWLPGAIESVLGQTWPHFRLLVSDNVSTDETREVVESFDDPRLSYVRLDEHLPLDEHFNLCFRRSSTEFLFALPDDDRMAPNLLETTVPVLDRNPSAGIAHGQATVVDEHGAVIAERHNMTGLAADSLETGEEFIRRSMEMSIRVYTPAALIRTAAIRNIRLDAEDVPIADLGLWLRMALNWDMAFIARPLATSRIHPSAHSAALADVDEGGYAKTASGILKAHEVKLRFIGDHRERLAKPADLLARAQGGLRQDLLTRVGHSTLPERRLTTTARALMEAARIDARVLLEPTAWRLLAGGVLGRRGVSLAKRILRPA